MEEIAIYQNRTMVWNIMQQHCEGKEERQSDDFFFPNPFSLSVLFSPRLESSDMVCFLRSFPYPTLHRSTRFWPAICHFLPFPLFPVFLAPFRPLILIISRPIFFPFRSIKPPLPLRTNPPSNHRLEPTPNPCPFQCPSPLHSSLPKSSTFVNFYNKVVTKTLNVCCVHHPTRVVNRSFLC